MKILFLDIDGVLNSSYYESQHGLAVNNFGLDDRGLDPAAVEILRPLFDDEEIYTVISSDWKYHYTLEEFQKMFPDYRVIDTTKIATKDYGKRMDEILDYVTRHSEINAWCAIDDIVLSHTNAVLTYDHYGIRPKHVDKIKKVLDDY